MRYMTSNSRKKKKVEYLIYDEWLTSLCLVELMVINCTRFLVGLYMKKVKLVINIWDTNVKGSQHQGEGHCYVKITC